MSDARFADGLRYRIEIPSVEGPRVLEAVLDEAERRAVPVRRVSQGSGVMMLTDAEIVELARLGELRRQGELPSNLVLKTSVLLPCANPASARTLEELGATTINVSTDLSVETLAEIRAACTAPLDVYVEAPDDQGGFVRHYDVPDLIRVAAPLYVKLGLRNAPNIYPSGLHLEDTAIRLGRERVRRAELVLRLVAERAPELVEGRGADAPPDLAIPG